MAGLLACRVDCPVEDVAAREGRGGLLLVGHDRLMEKELMLQNRLKGDGGSNIMRCDSLQSVKRVTMSSLTQERSRGEDSTAGKGYSTSDDVRQGTGEAQERAGVLK